MIDREDVDLFASRRWHIAKMRKTKYLVTGRGIYFHRIVTNAPKELHVDHRNGDGLDNRRTNLRFATPGQNMANSGPKTARYKGVRFYRGNKTNPWRAQIGIDGKRIWLGDFPTEEQAAKAYDAAAREHWGEYAWTNFDA